MLLLLLKIVGWVLAHTPEAFLRLMSAFLGDLVYLLSRRRRTLLLSNLHHAFPNDDFTRRRRIARESCRRLIETGLLSIASPYLSDSRIREIAQLTSQARVILERRSESKRPLILGSPHLAYWESQTWIGHLLGASLGRFGVFYRPLDNPQLNQFVLQTRERFGMELLSRKEGLSQALKIMRTNGAIGILFDQNAGLQGALTTLFGRVCSTTELPGILAEKFAAEVAVISAHRKKFWRVTLDIEVIDHDGSAPGVTIALNQWLECKFAADENLSASWLWSHNRWRNQDIPERRLRLEAKRNLLPTELKLRDWKELPRRTRVFIRLPNWLGDVVMAIPLLRAIRRSRPDAELTLIGKAPFQELVTASGVVDHFIPLPPQGWKYWFPFLQLRHRYPDVYLLFTNSTRGDLEAWLSGCRQRFGIQRPGKKRPALSHVFRPSSSFNEQQNHQLDLWSAFLQHFGLTGAPECTPLIRTERPSPAGPRTIGLIAGSENMPAKRWPIQSWRSLIEAFPECRFVLFGTPGDRLLTDQIASNLPGSAVENLAGKTDLAGFARELQRCDLLVSNDTGGMHLGNAWGVPLIGLFGPTNPIRTRPVFSSPVEILQPPGCPATGGGNLADLKPEVVIAAVRKRLASTASGE